jgi:hypothetical protein
MPTIFRIIWEQNMWLYLRIGGQMIMSYELKRRRFTKWAYLFGSESKRKNYGKKYCIFIILPIFRGSMNKDWRTMAYLIFYFIYYDLFNVVFSISVSVHIYRSYIYALASNGRMIMKYWIGNEVEANCYSLIWGIFFNLHSGGWNQSPLDTAAT